MSALGFLTEPFAEVSRAIRLGPESFDGFPAYAEHLSHALARAACILALVGTFALWPTDLLLFHDHPRILHGFAVGRIVCGAWLLAGFVAVDHMARRGRRTSVAWLVVSAGTVALAFHIVARYGRPGEPWFFAALMVPILCVVLVVPIGRRIGLAVVYATAALGAYFGTAPPELHAPFIGSFVAVIGSAFAMTVTVGHILYLFVATSFEQAEELERANRTDALTQVHSRAYTLGRAREELARAERAGSPVGFLLVDVDHFKAINDTHGHAVGDDVLRHTARRMREALRSSDVAGRIGGEEFLIVLPDTPAEAAHEVAERVRAAVAGSASETLPRVTVSVGVAVHEPRAAGELTTVLRRADEALYAAKRGGRDRVAKG